MKLSAEVVKELQKLRARLAALERKEERLTKSIKKQLKHDGEKEYAPRDYPFKLVITKTSRASVSWKEEWVVVAEKYYGDKWTSKEKKLIKDNQKSVVSLIIEPNIKEK